MPNWRTDASEFVHLISAIEEQIALAKTDPAFHQKATVVECGAAISCLKRRLAAPGNEVARTSAMLAYSAIYTGHWQFEWQKLATSPVDKFLTGADELLDGVERLRGYFESQALK